MPQIQESTGVVTQITTIDVDPKNEPAVLATMKERARFMATQPGFVSISLHRSADKSHIVNYVQWASRDQLTAAHQSPEFRKKWPELGKIAKDIEPCLYDVVLVEEK